MMQSRNPWPASVDAARADEEMLMSDLMTTKSAEMSIIARNPVTLVWMLFARSVGLAAGVAVALLAVSALLWVP